MRCSGIGVSLLSVLLLCGCANGLRQPERVDEIVTRKQDSALSCPAEAPRRCAIDSPLYAALPDNDTHRLLVLQEGTFALITRVHMIRAARERILLQNHIITDDSVSRLLLDELIRAARRGVQVRILADALLSLPDPRLQASLETAHSNLELRLYNPVRNQAVIDVPGALASLVCCFGQVNHRMHNKIVSIDGRHAILGGRNTGARYFDLDTRMNYFDYEVLVSGREVARVEASFMEYWHHDLSQPARYTRDVAGALHAGDTTGSIATDDDRLEFVRRRALESEWLDAQWRDREFFVDRVVYFHDPPGDKHRETPTSPPDSTGVLHDLIREADHSIMIQIPYLVLSQAFADALADAGDIHITISTNSLASTDAFPVYAISRRERHRLLARFPAEVYEMKPLPDDIFDFVPRYPTLMEEKQAGIATSLRTDMRPPTRDIPGPRLSLHGKLLAVDDDIAVVTAHNFDPRSETWNTENGLIVYDRHFNASIRKFISASIAPGNSWRSRIKPPGIPILGGINRLLARGSRHLPTLDLWPTYLTGNYEQQPDGEMGQPVGQFPEVRLGRRLSTGFISRMMGFTKPLM